MKKSIMLHQITILENLAMEIHQIKDDLFKECNENMQDLQFTEQKNRFYNNNYKETQDLLYNHMQELFEYIYELNKKY